MDAMLQRHCAKYIYVVPDGLRELMSDISREVLRSHPENIYSFIADYLDALMITRENARVAARLIESLTEIGLTIAGLLVRTGMSRLEADKVATVIQVTFRKHLTGTTPIHPSRQVNEVVEEANIITQIIDQAGITPDQAEQAASIIQNAYHNFKKRQERERDLLRGMVDWRVAARSTMRLYRKTGVTYEEANRAATLIKAAYKGYYTRRTMRKLVEESEHASTDFSDHEMLEEEDSTDAYWAHFADGAPETEFYDDLEEVSASAEDEEFESNPDDDEQHEQDVQEEQEQDSQAVALGIVNSLLKHMIPDSSAEAPELVSLAKELSVPLVSDEDSGIKTETAEGEVALAEEKVEPEVATHEPPQEAEEVPAEGTLVEGPPNEAGDASEPTTEPLSDATERETDRTAEDTSASEAPNIPEEADA